MMLKEETNKKPLGTSKGTAHTRLLGKIYSVPILNPTEKRNASKTFFSFKQSDLSFLMVEINLLVFKNAIK